MKTLKALFSTLVFTVFLVLVSPMIRSEAATSGTCGENLTWELSGDGKTLTISGSGEMEDYDYYNDNK